MEQRRALIDGALSWGLFVKLAVFATALVSSLVALRWPDDPNPHAKPLLLIIATIPIFLSAFPGLFLYYKFDFHWKETGFIALPRWPSGFDLDLRPKVTEFPLHFLIVDFVNLGVLVVFTGGYLSPFLPLLVLALILGDIAVEPIEKNHFWGFVSKTRAMAFGTLIISVVAGEIDAVRTLLVNGGETPAARSALVFHSGGTIFLAVTVLSLGTFFGSVVIENFRKRQGAPAKAPPVEPVGPQPPLAATEPETGGC